MLSGPRQKFAEGIAAGLNGAAAYRAAYPKASMRDAQKNQSRLTGNDGIKAEITRIRAAAASQPGSAILTLAMKRDALAAIACARDGYLGGEVKTSDRLRALELDAKLAGELSERLQVEGIGEIRVVIGQ